MDNSTKKDIAKLYCDAINMGEDEYHTYRNFACLEARKIKAEQFVRNFFESAERKRRGK